MKGAEKKVCVNKLYTMAHKFFYVCKKSKNFSFAKKHLK